MLNDAEAEYRNGVGQLDIEGLRRYLAHYPFRRHVRRALELLTEEHSARVRAEEWIASVRTEYPHIALFTDAGIRSRQSQTHHNSQEEPNDAQ